MKNKANLFITAGSLIVLINACGFPGPLITYNKEFIRDVTDSTIIKEVWMDYFCLDYDRNFQCQKSKSVTYDSLTGVILEIEII